MKSIFYFILLFFSCVSYSQIGINNETPSSSAMLDASSVNNKGIVFPKVALVATNSAIPVVSPAVSLMVYNTATSGTTPNSVVPGYYYWNGTNWVLFKEKSLVTNEVISRLGNFGTFTWQNLSGTVEVSIEMSGDRIKVEKLLGTDGYWNVSILGNVSNGSTVKYNKSISRRINTYFFFPPREVVLDIADGSLAFNGNVTIIASRENQKEGFVMNLVFSESSGGFGGGMVSYW